jgi:Tfp pilus assembly protein PilP
VRPVVEYKSGKLRDPFRTYFVKEEVKKDSPQENPDMPKPEFDLSKLKVQGIVWGGKSPQAIINGQVLSVGDLIEGAQIVSIEKKGITLSFVGAIFDLAAPG